MVDRNKIRTGSSFPLLPHPSNYAINAWASQLVATLQGFFQAAAPVSTEMIQDEAVSTEKLGQNSTHFFDFTQSENTLPLPQVPTSTRVLGERLNISSSKSNVLIWFNHIYKSPRIKTYILLDSATPANYPSNSFLVESFSSSQNTSQAISWAFQNVTPGAHSISIYCGVISPTTANHHNSINRTLTVLTMKNAR